MKIEYSIKIEINIINEINEDEDEDGYIESDSNPIIIAIPNLNPIQIFESVQISMSFIRYRFDTTSKWFFGTIKLV